METKKKRTWVGGWVGGWVEGWVDGWRRKKRSE